MGFEEKLFGKDLGFADTAIPLVLAWTTLEIDSLVSHEGLVILLNFIMLIGGLLLILRIAKSNFVKWRAIHLLMLSFAMILLALANMTWLVTEIIKIEMVKVLAHGLITVVVISNFLGLISTLNLEKRKKFLTKKEVKQNESTKKVFGSIDSPAGSNFN